MPGLMPTWRQRLPLIVRDSGAVRLPEIRLAVLTWPEPCIARNGDRGQLTKSFPHRYLGEIPGAEGDALRVIHASRQKCRPITAEMVVAKVSIGRR